MSTTFLRFPHLFQPATNELRSAARDAYLQNALDATDAQAVEAFLADNAVERGVLLGRYHELATVREREGLQPLPPPAWARQQLRRQASASVWGPLRRPSIQVSLAMLLVLSGFSVVQWLRNEPLVPQPLRRPINVVAARLGQPAVYTAAELAPTEAEAEVQTVPTAARSPLPGAKSAALSAGAAARPLAEASQPGGPAVGGPLDSVAVAVSAAPDSLARTPAPRGPEGSAGNLGLLASTNGEGSSGVGSSRHLMHGHVFNERGRPLAGATVLVKGTAAATVTDASGAYELEVPAGAVLQIGYAGYDEEALSVSQAGSIDATLEPHGRRRGRRSID